MWIKPRLLVLYIALSVCISTTPDFLDVNLLDKVNTTSAGTPAFSILQSTLEMVTISWMIKPPYIFDEKQLEKTQNEHRPGMLHARKARSLASESKDDNGRESTGERINEKEFSAREPNVTGIFKEIVTKGLQICGRISPENVNYTENVNELQQLDQTIVKKEADIILPVHGSEDGFYGGHAYVEVLKSPGVVFIVNKQQTLEHLRKRVLQAMKDTWPVIAITLLLAGFAGMLIWGLDTSRNPDHFPRSFTRGVMDGIWWSFVSMTTVGYGDRIPKSMAARLFGILWILTGLVLCSFFTATFTSALTSSSLHHRNSLLGVKVAVISDSHAYDEALKQAANVKDYTNFFEMYDALVVKGEVEGILADIYTASYYMHKINDPRLAVSMFFGTQHSIGFAISERSSMMEFQLPCLTSLFKYRQRDIKKIILRHTEAFHTETRNRKMSDEETDEVWTLLDGNSPGFRTTLHAMLITFFMLLTMGFVYESCVTRIRDKRITISTGGNIDSNVMEVEFPTCKPNR